MHIDNEFNCKLLVQGRWIEVRRGFSVTDDEWLHGLTNPERRRVTVRLDSVDAVICL